MSAKVRKTQEDLRAILDPETHLEQLRSTLAQLKMQASTTVIGSDLLGEVKEEDTDEEKERKEG